MSESSRGRGKKIAAPRGRGRRTQAERDQILQAERERNRERDRQYAQEQNSARLAQERAERDRKRREENAARGRGRGRGGFMGDNSVKHESSGPLSSGSAIGAHVAQGRAFPRPWAPSKKSGAGGRGSSGGGDDIVIGGGGGGGVGGSSRAAVLDFQVSEGFKDDAIDGGYISSDLDEPESGERRPIETIDLISEDEDEGTASFSAPIRLIRIEHRARTVQVNADAGESQAIKTEDGDVAMADAPEASRAKSKQRDRSLEITKERPFQGVWRDEPEIKEEQPAEEPRTRIRGPSKENDEDAEQITRRSKQSSSKTPVFFNEEERKEYLRAQADNEVMVAEFGDIEAHKEDTRTYLFQFPPVMPNLAVQKPITIKDDPDAPPTQQPNGTSSTSANNKDAPIKIEEGETDPLKPDDLVKDPTVRPKHLPQLASGSVGKLRVHKSGKVTMDWGGSAFVVHNGVAPDFLQNLVMLRMDEQTPDAAAAAVPTTMLGNATAFGQPRGKLIVQPDWDQMLEGAVKGMKVE